MALNYSQLTTAISDYTENTFSPVDLNFIITRVEQYVYNTVQFQSLRKTVNVPTILGSRFIVVPSDFLSAYSLAIIDSANNYSFLINKDTNYMQALYPNPAQTGIPKYYGIWGPPSPARELELQFVLGPTPNAIYATELQYFYYPASMTQTLGASWLGDNFDIALLNGCLYEAAVFMKQEQDIIGENKDRFMKSLEMLRNLGDGKQRSDDYRSGQARVKVR